jgi:hypothetical protein
VTTAEDPDSISAQAIADKVSDIIRRVLGEHTTYEQGNLHRDYLDLVTNHVMTGFSASTASHLRTPVVMLIRIGALCDRFKITLDDGGAVELYLKLGAALRKQFAAEWLAAVTDKLVELVCDMTFEDKQGARTEHGEFLSWQVREVMSSATELGIDGIVRELLFCSFLVGERYLFAPLGPDKRRSLDVKIREILLL